MLLLLLVVVVVVGVVVVVAVDVCTVPDGWTPEREKRGRGGRRSRCHPLD